MIRFKLAEILDDNKYQLSRVANVRPITISDMYKNKTKRIELATLEKILLGINQLILNRSIDVGDLMEYIPDE